MEFIWVLFAFICGLGARALALPPLIGFLSAGFILHFMGVEPTASMETLANLGITLMLFTIGLKLNVKDLLKAEVWASTLGHMGIWIAIVTMGLLFLATLSMPYYSELDLKSAAVLAFALSFSSTVCIVKLLEEAGEAKTRHGKLAIGVLVMQDIAAVLFLVASTGKLPSIWAVALLGLYWARPLLNRLLSHAGHGELLPLTGFFLALGSYELFSLVGVKGDLGALVGGMLLAGSAKATELSKSLMSFKDIFLIGFFLSIGFTALPDLSMVLIAAMLALLIPLKFGLFFLMFCGLRLRGRTAYLSSLALANFSEFGLIVAAISTDIGLLSKEWLVILALAVSISFVITSVLYRSAHTLYMYYKGHVCRFERSTRLPEDVIHQPDGAQVLIIGLGRVGKGALQTLTELRGDQIWGMDADRNRISQLQSQGKQVFFGDGEDADLWEQLDSSRIRLVMMALPSIEDMQNITVQLRNSGYKGKIAAVARYEDEREPLLNAGIDHVFNFFTGAGTGFAEESLQMVDGVPVHICEQPKAIGS